MSSENFIPNKFPGDSDAAGLRTLAWGKQMLSLRWEVGGKGRMEIQVGKKSGAKSSSSSTGRRTLRASWSRGGQTMAMSQQPSSSWEASEQWEEECGVRIRPWLIILILSDSGTTLWAAQVS